MHILRIGIIPLAAKPLPSPEGTVSAPGIVTTNLIKGLREAGHSVTVFTGEDSQTTADMHRHANLSSTWKAFGPEQNNTISYTERRAELDLIYANEAIKAYQRGELDIIHAHDYRLSPYIFSQAQVPVLYTPHIDLRTRLTAYDHYRYNVIRESQLGLTAISKQNLQTLQELDINSAGYTPNGIDIDQYQFQPNNRAGLLIVSRMVAGKCIKEAIDAAGQTGYDITVIGPVGPKESDKQYFQELEQDYFSRPYVTYLGLMTPDQLVPYFQKATALLYLSESEGMPLTILEAMATGLIPVASNVGGIPDVIEDGLNGFLLPDNTASTIAEKLARLDTIDRTNCQLTIETHYTLQKMTANYLAAYRQFIN